MAWDCKWREESESMVQKVKNLSWIFFELLFSAGIDSSNPGFCQYCKCYEFDKPIIEHFKKCQKSNAVYKARDKLSQKADEKRRKKSSEPNTNEKQHEKHTNMKMMLS